MVPRLNGQEIRKRFSYYPGPSCARELPDSSSLAESLKRSEYTCRSFRMMAEIPLIVSSDLERGLGQQLKGGTHFPPAMALAEAYKNRQGLKEEGQRSIPVEISLLYGNPLRQWREAKYAGINTIFSPVLRHQYESEESDHSRPCIR